MEFKAGDVVQIMERGEWIGSFTVLPAQGRTEDHLVLFNSANGMRFEHCADEFNTRHDPNVKVIPLTLSEYNRITEAEEKRKVEWPVPESTNYDESLAAARRRMELESIRMGLREAGLLPINGVLIVDRITHNCVTPDFLWERMAPSLELRDMDGNIPSYSEFEAYAIIRSHEEFPGTDQDNGTYCDSCDCLRMIWLRYQLTAFVAEVWRVEGVKEFKQLQDLRTAIRYELEIACDDSNRGPASNNHPVGKAE